MSAKEENEITLVGDENEEELVSDDNIVPTNKVAAETADELEKELDRFRQDWKKELVVEKRTTSGEESEPKSTIEAQTIKKGRNVAEYHSFPQRVTKPMQKTNNEEISQELDYEDPSSNEHKAQYLFEKGVQLEQQGRHYEAIKFYRLAMQLDADIELKIASHRFTRKRTDQSAPVISSEQVLLNVEDSEKIAEGKEVEEEEDDEVKSLYQLFQNFTLSENRLCDKNYPQKSTHISQLPLEVIMLILKWVVSDHLDMRSLDCFALVCKGFYVCARDPEIWRLACAKIWGQNNINNQLGLYGTYRSMFLNRARLNFDGVYICKTSYARQGEQSLDNFYRPWHLVEYYRYLRFFPDGTVLFFTTPDEPKITVAKLKNKSANTASLPPAMSTFVLNDQSILNGSWTLTLNKVSIVICKKIIRTATNKFSRRNMNKEPSIDQEHIFRIELDLSSNEKKLNNLLYWSNYEIQIINNITNTKNATQFELNKIDFPNFFFSRVKSYSLNSDKPL